MCDVPLVVEEVVQIEPPEKKRKIEKKIKEVSKGKKEKTKGKKEKATKSKKTPGEKKKREPKEKKGEIVFFVISVMFVEFRLTHTIFS